VAARHLCCIENFNKELVRAGCRCFCLDELVLLRCGDFEEVEHFRLVIVGVLGLLAFFGLKDLLYMMFSRRFIQISSETIFGSWRLLPYCAAWLNNAAAFDTANGCKKMHANNHHNVCFCAAMCL
jgi:hypothetical protein